MPHYTILDAPSVLGLRPTGVEKLPEALKAAGLSTKLRANYAGRVTPLPYNPERNPATHLLNGEAIRTYSLHLADAVAPVVEQQQFPIVLGGECSTLIGCMLALRRLGHYGLFFIDGHTDFYQPEAELRGEVASMELALVSGRGPTILTDLDGLKPLVHDQDIVAFGFRDAEQAVQEGSQDIHESPIHVYDLAQVRSLGIATAATQALSQLLGDNIAGFWIHLDADVLDDAIMPAVDYRMPDGLSFDELSAVLRRLLAPGRAIGMTITIFNPALDRDGSIAGEFVESIVAGLV
jgi:arginase